MALCTALGGCPDTPPEPDAGPSPEPTTQPDAGEPSVSPDAGTPNDAGAGEPDAGVAPNDDGGSPSPDAGVEPNDGGTPQSCPIVNPCNGVAVSSTAIFTPNTTAPSVSIDGSAITIGSTTRAQAEVILGALVEDTSNPFRSYACAAALDLRFVDDLNGDFFEGTASPNDIIARVLTHAGSTATSSRGASIGGGRIDGFGNFTNHTSFPLGDALFDFDHTMGIGFRSKNNVIEQFLAYLPQDDSRWGMDIDLQGLALVNGDTTFSAGNRDLNDANAFFGTAHDVQGEIDIGSNLAEVHTRSYASTGIRFADICPLGNCNDIETVVLSPPFVGKDSTGLGIGSTQAEFEAQMGAATGYSGEEPVQEDNVHLYGADQELAVLYVQDESCIKRVAAIILGFVEAP
ncbi:MAG: hypothetical protein GY822_25610 [Deltaproteobacteria bacterium]|nr:hypothetical protein [Deltaproteobacteria bacterium]